MSQPPTTQPSAPQPEVVRYIDRPDLWESLGDLSSEVWPEYNLHGDVLELMPGRSKHGIPALRCPHRIPAEIEAALCELKRSIRGGDRPG
jgi:hypothetical protein